MHDKDAKDAKEELLSLASLMVIWVEPISTESCNPCAFTSII